MFSSFSSRAALTCVALAVIAAGVGCTSPMALTPALDSVDMSKKSVAIFTLRGANTLRGGAYQPATASLDIGKGTSTSGTTFAAPPSNNPWADNYREALISVALEPGEYTIGTVKGEGGTVQGSTGLGIFNFPLGTHFTLPPNSVVYIGRAVMTNVERKNGEKPSGSIFPIIPQAMSGFASGTMKIELSDASAEDIPKFVSAYHCLKGVTIQTAMMTR